METKFHGFTKSSQNLRKLIWLKLISVKINLIKVFINNNLIYCIQLQIKLHNGTYIKYIEVAMVNFLIHCLRSLLIHFLFQEHHDVIENLERVVNQPEHCCLNHFLFAVSILQEENFHLCPQSQQNQKGSNGCCP